MASKSGSLAEVYAVLNQLQDAYEKVLLTFQTVIIDVGEIKDGLHKLQEFVQEQFADAVSARNMWRSVAEAHKAELEKLREQLAALREGG